MTGLMPGLINDIISTAPKDQKVRSSKMSIAQHLSPLVGAHEARRPSQPGSRSLLDYPQLDKKMASKSLFQTA